jgi:hypothetical protein
LGAVRAPPGDTGSPIPVETLRPAVRADACAKTQTISLSESFSQSALLALKVLLVGANTMVASFLPFLGSFL